MGGKKEEAAIFQDSVPEVCFVGSCLAFFDNVGKVVARRVWKWSTEDRVSDELRLVIPAAAGKKMKPQQDDTLVISFSADSRFTSSETWKRIQSDPGSSGLQVLPICPHQGHLGVGASECRVKKVSCC